MLVFLLFHHISVNEDILQMPLISSLGTDNVTLSWFSSSSSLAVASESPLLSPHSTKALQARALLGMVIGSLPS